MTTPQPPGDPNQQPAYPPPPYAPPAYPPTYPPADPNQAAAYPGQPPAYPGQPPAYPPTYPPGYASPSMPLYQQPQQPYPYGTQPMMQPGVPMMQPGMQPGMPTSGAGAMNFAMLTQPQQRGFLVVGIGAVIVLLGFFLLPVYTESTVATVFTPASSAVVHGSDTGFLGWVAFLCSVVAGGLAIWRAISTQPSGLTRKGAAITAIVLGSIAALFMLIITLFFSTFSGSIFGVATASVSFGAWLLLLATVAILVGGIMQANTKP